MFFTLPGTIHGFFNHGHLYTAVTRTRRSRDTVFLVRKKQKIVKNCVNRCIRAGAGVDGPWARDVMLEYLKHRAS